jgi:hypothetical protein
VVQVSQIDPRRIRIATSGLPAAVTILTIKDTAIAAAIAGFIRSSNLNPMPLSAVIVDDEQLARDELAYLLKNLDDVNVVAQGKNGLEAISLIREQIRISCFSTSTCRAWTVSG